MEFPLVNFFTNLKTKVKNIAIRDNLVAFLTNEIEIFDLYSEKHLLTFDVSTSSKSLQFLNNSKEIQIICSGNDGFVHLFNLHSGQIRRKKLKNNVEIFQCTSNNHFMILGDSYGELVTIEIASLEPVYRRKSHDSSVTCISLSDQYVISGSKDKRIQILKAPNLKQIQMIEEKNYITSLFNDRNQIIYVGLDNGYVKSYNFRGEALETYKGVDTHFVCSLTLCHEFLIYHQDTNSMNGKKINLIHVPQKERYYLEEFDQNICALSVFHYQFISRIFFADIKGKIFEIAYLKKYDFGDLKKLKDCHFSYVLPAE